MPTAAGTARGAEPAVVRAPVAVGPLGGFEAGLTLAATGIIVAGFVTAPARGGPPIVFAEEDGDTPVMMAAIPAPGVPVML